MSTSNMKKFHALRNEFETTWLSFSMNINSWYDNKNNNWIFPGLLLKIEYCQLTYNNRPVSIQEEFQFDPLKLHGNEKEIFSHAHSVFIRRLVIDFSKNDLSKFL